VASTALSATAGSSARRLAALSHDPALSWALRGTCLLLVAVAIGGIGSVLIFGAPTHPAGVFNPPGLASGLGGTRDALVAPFVRFDAAWYLWTSLHGYGAGGSPAGVFFPLYPLLVSIVAPLGVGAVVAGILIAIVSTILALTLIYKLTDFELGARFPDAPRLAVLATALFPAAFFLTAAYPESLFLALSLGAMWMARHERWAWAGVLGGLAAAAQSLGVLILVPVGLLYLQATHWRPRWSVLWLALIPAGYGAFMGWLAIRGLDPLSVFYGHNTWRRESVNPISGLWLAVRAAWAGVRQYASGQSTTVYWSPAISYGFTPDGAALANLEQFVFLIGGVLAAIGAVRRLPAAYGWYVVALLLTLVSDPIAAEPLQGIPRFLGATFTVPIVLGTWLARHPRLRVPVLGVSALALLYLCGRFATWHLVA
jgi:hypothetical protein